MSSFTYEKVPCPHSYYPSDTSRQMWRFRVLSNNEEVGYTDYFIENNWLHYLVYYMKPEFRTNENIIAFINNAYDAEPSVTKSFWWQTPDVMEQYFDTIASQRPNMTFAASGSINRIIHATA